jgi:hypothetical protein
MNDAERELLKKLAEEAEQFNQRGPRAQLLMVFNRLGEVLIELARQKGK